MRAPDALLAAERLVADGLSPLLSELRMIDLSVLVDQVTHGRHGCLHDIVETAAETHYAPGFVRYDGDADMVLEWDHAPMLSIAIALRDGALDARIKLLLRRGDGAIELQRLAPDQPIDRQTPVTGAQLADALGRNRLNAC